MAHHGHQRCRVIVSELIALLEEQDPDAEVLVGDNDHSYFDVDDIALIHVLDGYEVAEPGSGGSPEAPPGDVKVVVIRP